MAYRFTDPSAFPYQSDALFLGLDPATNREVGIETERHAITIGGAGTGKGAALLIPNARRWPHNLLCVDVKGENAAASWEAREAMGQHIGVLDPYGVADIPDRLRVSINPLGAIDPDADNAAEDLIFLADGMIVRSNPKNAEWDNGARDILAGVMGYVLSTKPPHDRTLSAMRSVLIQPNEITEGEGDDAELIGGLYHDAQRMAESDACGGLVKSAGVTIMAALESESGRPSKFLEGARTATRWLDSKPMKKALGSSSFNLADLKSGKASLFVVLPPKYLGAAAGFFRLFVQSAIAAMQSTPRIERRCLFLLDEFFILGRMDEIAKAAGLMRGYGLHLWPFLQDLGQLHELYGPQLSETFFGNADAAIFLGNSDILTLEYISRRLGKLTPQEITPPPPIEISDIESPAHARPAGDGFFSTPDEITAQNENNRRAVEHRNQKARAVVDQKNAKARAEYEHAMRRVGSPRLTPDEIAPLIGKGKGDVVARSMIVFGPSGAALNLKPAPYFETPRQTWEHDGSHTREHTDTRTRAQPMVTQQSRASNDLRAGVIAVIVGAAAGFFLARNSSGVLPWVAAALGAWAVGWWTMALRDGCQKWELVLWPITMIWFIPFQIILYLIDSIWDGAGTRWDRKRSLKQGLKKQARKFARERRAAEKEKAAETARFTALLEGRRATNEKAMQDQS